MSKKETIVLDSAIDLALDHLENMSDQELADLFERMSKQQVSVMGFVAGLGEGLEDEEAEEDLYYLAVIIWHSIELSKNDTLTTVPEKELENIVVRMTNLFEEIISFTDEDEEDSMANLINSSTQPALANYLADEFFSDQYIRLSEDKVAKMFACMLGISETLGEA